MERRLTENDLFEKKICELMGQNHICEEAIREIEHESIAKCTVEGMKAFILCRREDLPKSKLPKKGKISDAIKGERNLIALVYECLTLPNLMKQKIKEYEATLDTSEDNENFESLNLNLTLSAEEECLLTPSSLLSNNEWVQ